MDGDTPKPMMPLPCPMERLKSFEERKREFFADEPAPAPKQCSAAKAADAALAAKKADIAET